MANGIQPNIHPFFEPNTCSWQYVVACPKTKEAAIIDPTLNYKPEGFLITTEAADKLIKCVLDNGYTVTMLLETHIHGGHLSAVYYIQQTLWSRGHTHAQICMGENVKVMQSHFAHKFHIPKEELYNAFDHLFEQDETFNIGELTGIAIYLPGHTQDHILYKIEGNIFTGDSIARPDVHSERCDFPGGNHRELFRSMKQILDFPPPTKLYAGHDYPPPNEEVTRNPFPYVTISEREEQKKEARDDVAEDEFVKWRTERDKVMPEPTLVHQAPQINVRGGKLPGKSHEGKGYLLYVINVPKVLLGG
ncbi:uncharacterized protein N7479_010350 [Penicillium vulpinum]|uniref:uncharacterized protein n=1 Tax=Penicillium vulpinum TaxID=29845 RepID=UPI00254741CB|nr:uncharacterized protein N7479_010350 [Penicillium vulpinum]KAJ5951937.1 hypothetical protein N7479_010350 [Penicillium vulpinum]